MGPRIIKLLLYITGIGLVLLVAGYFIAGALVRKKADALLRQLPPSLTVTYTGLDVGLLKGSVVIHGLSVSFAPEGKHSHRLTADRIAVEGIRFWTLLSAKKLKAGVLRVEGGNAELDQELLEKNIPLPKVELPFTSASFGTVECAGMQAELFKGARKMLFMSFGGTIDSVAVAGLDSGAAPVGGTRLQAGGTQVQAGGMGLQVGGMRLEVGGMGLQIGRMRLLAKEIRYTIPGADETVRLSNLELDSRAGRLKVDSLRVQPTLDKFEMGRTKGHQVDVVEARTEGIEVEGLDVLALRDHRLIADTIRVRKNTISVFRDRRLPLEPGEKLMPAESLKNLPVSVRVRSVKIGTTSFAYEEFPKKGDKSGTLKILGLKGTISPVINHPAAGDPDYMTIRTEGSLMGSGSVEAVTKVPLRKGNPYEVEGAFHELDVTTLNGSAENLGRIHLESGRLNSLAFWFKMDNERSTGKIIGEYHDLVVDKLRENSDEKKVDKVKSFFLKQFIIPKDKDRLLPEKKRTGKVDYKRDPNRYFSYYLLHSLLVGVKSSFSLGFLLPG